MRRRLGKTLVTLAFPAALALPAWVFLASPECGRDLTVATAPLLFASPVLLLSGSVLLIAHRPRSVGYWAVAIVLGLPFWYVAALSTGCSVE